MPLRKNTKRNKEGKISNAVYQCIKRTEIRCRGFANVTSLNHAHKRKLVKTLQGTKKPTFLSIYIVTKCRNIHHPSHIFITYKRTNECVLYLRIDFPPEGRGALEDVVKEVLTAVERHKPGTWETGVG